MPERPGVDDDDALKRLIALWTDADDELARRRDEVLSRINGMLVGNGPVDPAIVGRLRIQTRRLEELTRAAQGVAGDLRDETGAWINAGGMDRIYESGAGVTASAASVPFTFSAPHRAAADVLAQDLYNDVLEATSFVDNESKALIREMGRVFTGRSITVGDTALQAGRRLTREMAGVGMATVTYRNGARVPMGHYAEMLLRTKTAVAYNTGTLNHAKVVGIEVFELLDGADCGLTSHTDKVKANGLLVGYETAMAYPIAHPRCRRATNPRPDLPASAIESQEFESVQSEERRADQAAFERALSLEQTNRRQRRQRATRGSTRRTRTTRGTTRTQRPARATRATRAATPSTDADLSGIDTKAVDDFTGVLPPNQVTRAARGPMTREGPMGPGSAMVDDAGRFYYAEGEDAAARIAEMVEQNRVSVPDGTMGPRTNIVTNRASKDEAAWSDRYGQQFHVAANAGEEGTVNFRGAVDRNTTYHENGHHLARAMNNKGQLADDAAAAARRAEAEGGFPNRVGVGPQAIDDAIEKVETEARQSVLGSFDPDKYKGGSNARPGDRYFTAMYDDAQRLDDGALFPEFEPSGGLQYNGRGTGQFANQPRVPAVSDYGASVPGTEDFAESWLGYLVDIEEGAIGSYRGQDGFVRPVTFAEMFPSRAAFFDELLADLAG